MIDLTGRVFTEWTVLRFSCKTQKNKLVWFCRCSCGAEKEVHGNNLISGRSRSCGCKSRAWAAAKRRTHGHTVGYKELRRFSTEYSMFANAKHRASVRGIPFNIELSDIQIPAICPLLGTEIVLGHVGKGTARNSPTLDRIVTDLGYVKGNVWVISSRANTIKNDASPEELELIASNLRRKIREAA